MIKNYFCFSPGDIFANNKGDEITIIDVLQEGYDPEDPNDMGSFEFTDVHYCWTKGWRAGKTLSLESYSLVEWLNKNKFKKVV